MLKQLRNKKTAKRIWIILSILVLPAFLLWGTGSIIRSKEKEPDHAGKIFGRKISWRQYQDAQEAVRNQAIMQFGDNLSQVEKYLNLESRAWERLILLNEAKIRKIKVSDEEVVDLIRKYPFFQRRGRFDQKIYLEILRFEFHTQPRSFEEQTRQNLTLSKLYKEVTDSITLKEEEIKEEYRKSNEEISLYYIAGRPADFTKEVSASEQEIKDYYSKNPLEFKQPLSFNVEYISVDSEDKAKNVLSSLNNKKGDINKTVKKLGVEIKETGFFTQTESIPGIGWSPEILNIISNLKVGQFSSPVRMDKKYYILKLKERKEPYTADFLAVKEKAKEALLKKKAKDWAKEKMENCLKKLKEKYQAKPKSADFNKLASEFGLKSEVTATFKYGSYIEGIGASDEFWMVSQGLKEGEFSPLIEVPSGFYIIKLKSHQAVDDKKFAAEKAEFSKQLLERKKQEYFVKFAEELSRKSGIPH